MDKIISTKFSLAIIVLLFSSVTVAILALIDSPVATNSELHPINLEKKLSSCQPRAFQGEAKIHVWQAKDENIVKIDQGDINILPVAKNKIKIVDKTPALEKKLANSTQDNPETITLTGFAVDCGEIAYGALKYEAEIFRQYIMK